MEMLLITDSVLDGDYILDCGYEVDMVGSVYIHHKDDNRFRKWFRKKMKPNGWTVTLGGAANQSSYQTDSLGVPYNFVYSIKRHFEGKGKMAEGQAYEFKYEIIKTDYDILEDK